MKTITYLIMIMVITIIAASFETLVPDAWHVIGIVLALVCLCLLRRFFCAALTGDAVNGGGGTLSGGALECHWPPGSCFCRNQQIGVSRGN